MMLHDDDDSSRMLRYRSEYVVPEPGQLRVFAPLYSSLSLLMSFMFEFTVFMYADADVDEFHL